MGCGPYETPKQRKRREAKSARRERVCEKFGKTPNPKNLVELFKEYQRFTPSCFLDEVFTRLNIRENNISEEFRGTEYETKLDIKTSVPRLGGTCEFPTSYLDHLDKRMKPDLGFLPAFFPVRRYSENMFYGKGPREILTIMAWEGRQSLKFKGESEPINFGLKGEEFVLKKSEEIKRNCSGLEMLSEVQKATLRGAKLMGSVKRARGKERVVSIPSGRMFDIIFDVCSVKRVDEEPFDRRQLEVEYRGFMPKFKGNLKKGDEEQMIKELIKLTNVVQEKIVGTISQKRRVKVAEPTIIRKYDFLLREEGGKES